MFFICIIIVIFVLDYLIKNRIEADRELDNREKEILNKELAICKHHNKGMVLNAFDKYQKLIAVFTGLGTLLAIIVCIPKLFDAKNINKFKKTGIAFLLGGAINNSYDRVFRTFVVDYLRLKNAPGKLKTVIFNLSDVFILIGAGMITVAEIFEEIKKGK